MSESMLWLLRDTRRAIEQGPGAVAQRQRAHLAEMVAWARAKSQRQYMMDQYMPMQQMMMMDHMMQHQQYMWMR